MRTSHGYEILRYELAAGREGVVLAHRGSHQMHPYVVWSFLDGVYTCGYYTDSLEKARQVFAERLEYYDSDKPMEGR